MKHTFFKSLTFTLLMFGHGTLVLAAFPVMTDPMAKMGSQPSPASVDDLERKLKRYSEQGKDAEGKCRANTGAGIDTSLGQQYNSACMASYKGAAEAADQYLSEQAKGNARLEAISKLNAASCGAGEDAGAQKACMENSAKNYDEAAKIKAQLAQELLDAYKKAKDARDQNAMALKRYREDLKKIEAAEAEARVRAEALRSQGDSMSAALTIQQVQKAQAVNTSGISVAARDGNAASLSEYKTNYGNLTKEQSDAQDYSSQFATDAKDGAYQLQNQSTKYEQMAAELRARAAALQPDSGISGDKAVPVPGDGVAARAEHQAQQAAKARAASTTTTGIGGKAVTNPAVTPGTAAYENTNSVNQPTATNASQTPASTNYGNAGAAMGPVAGMAGSAGGSSGVASSTGTNPGLTTPVNYQNNSTAQPAARSQVKSSNFGEVLGTHDPRVKEDSEQGVAEPEVKVENAVEKVASGSGLGGGGEEGEVTGASAAPGIRGANGKPIGFSSANGGDLQSSRRNMDRDAASGGGFSNDLQSGAVSIAGSEMKSAVQSLAEELGATDLDLDLGELTPEEKAALAPLEGGEGVRNLAPVKGGRRTASLIQGSDGSIQDEQSMALFSRARSAHERAVLRGNLILGTKKKL